MKSAIAASRPLRSGHRNKRMALFFKLSPHVAGHLTSVAQESHLFSATYVVTKRSEREYLETIGRNTLLAQYPPRLDQGNRLERRRTTWQPWRWSDWSAANSA